MRSYKTKQREQILEFFEENPDRCLSARELITESGIDAGQATVYRTLSMLTDENKLRRFRSDAGGDCYRLACAESEGNHMHIVCRVCGGMIHSECEFIDEMKSHLLNEHGFALDTGATVIYGVCAGCAGEKH